MKWFSVILIASLALLSNACEKHPASQLPAEHATAFGPHAAGHGSAEQPAAEPAAEHTAAKPKTAAQTGEIKSDDAPTFFPDKK